MMVKNKILDLEEQYFLQRQEKIQKIGFINKNQKNYKTF